MDLQQPIHDLFIEPLEINEMRPWQSLRAYAFDDHLLKRIGLIEILEFQEGEQIEPFLRLEADELWILVEGAVNFEWQDRRENSPTVNSVHKLNSVAPMRALVPFGVQFSMAANSDCLLVRISSHADDPTEYIRPTETLED